MKALQEQVIATLKEKQEADTEGMVLVSGLQLIGKTQGVLKCCADQGCYGFFLDLGRCADEEKVKEKVNNYVMEGIIYNPKVQRSWLNKALWTVMPSPSLHWGAFSRGLEAAFQGGGLTLVVDEAQVIANEQLRHSGMWNLFCKCSAFGPVILISSEYAIPQELKKMTHIASRTRVFYCPTATPDEMRLHVEQRFGAKHARLVLDKLDGSFRLLDWLDGRQLPEGIDDVRRELRADIEQNLGLSEDGLRDPVRASKTAQAMIAAARLAFGPSPAALGPNVLELAAVHGAKVEGGRVRKVNFATPLTGEVLNEMLCDPGVQHLLRKGVGGDSAWWAEFETATAGKCP